MQKIVLNFPILLIIGIAFWSGIGFATHQNADAVTNDDGNIWAVLVAGSNGWWNYRHQSDVCHAYHTLVDHGVAPAHIITMMYDDIANNSENPHSGKIYNHPKGGDVYAGVPIDYTGKEVTPENFMAVLLGQQDKVKKGKRVLKSTKKDKVFVFFSDHGANGLIGFPSDILTVKQLSDTLEQMHKDGLYNELTFYLEACESGSMFDRKRMGKLNMYAVSASNADESSYATYCSTELIPDGTCLGDEFSVNWMENADSTDLNTEKLSRQFIIVRSNTKNSHVTSFRNFKIQREMVAEFIGSKPKSRKSQMATPVAADGKQQQQQQYTKVPIRDIPLFMLSKNEKNAAKVTVLKQKRSYLEKMVEELVGKMLKNPEDQRHALTEHPTAVTQMECHHQLVNAFHQQCFNFNKNPYAMKYAYVLTNLCEHYQQEVPLEQAISIMTEHCAVAAHARNVQIGGIL